jgi:hypothetical protein
MSHMDVNPMPPTVPAPVLSADGVLTLNGQEVRMVKHYEIRDGRSVCVRTEFVPVN